MYFLYLFVVHPPYPEINEHCENLFFNIGVQRLDFGLWDDKHSPENIAIPHVGIKCKRKELEVKTYGPLGIFTFLWCLGDMEKGMTSYCLINTFAHNCFAFHF